MVAKINTINKCDLVAFLQNYDVNQTKIEQNELSALNVIVVLPKHCKVKIKPSEVL